MIKIENVEVAGFEAAIRGMRNPYNSHDKSDSRFIACNHDECPYSDDWLVCYHNPIHSCFTTKVGDNDLRLMQNLCRAGTDHRKFMRMIVAYMDITAPMYWWKEADTYKVGTVRNSCSTMHTITDKEFTIDDFSCESLSDDMKDCKIEDGWDTFQLSPRLIGYYTVKMLNALRKKYLETKDKKYWNQIIQLLPSSYNQKSTLMLNYEVLANIYHSRKNHKLTEWETFCEWIETLPYSELITGERG